MFRVASPRDDGVALGEERGPELEPVAPEFADAESSEVCIASHTVPSISIASAITATTDIPPVAVLDDDLKRILRRAALSA